MEADEAGLAADELEHDSAAVVVGARLASAVVIDHQPRIARRDEFSAEAIPEQLDLAFALAAGGISLRPLAAVALDVGGVAEGGEQGAVGGVPGLSGDKRKKRGAET